LAPLASKSTPCSRVAMRAEVPPTATWFAKQVEIVDGRLEPIASEA
jgi:hypothetical protein